MNTRRPAFLVTATARLLAVVGILAAGLWIGREPIMRAVGRVVYPFPYRDVVVPEARRAGVDPLLVVAVMREESGFSPDARSHAGARGLMQLMPDTARWVASKQARPAGDLDEPGNNIRLGAAYLGYLQRQFAGDLPRVLAAYNAGEGNVSRWKDLAEAFPETRRYVQRGVRTYTAYRWLYGAEMGGDGP